jgi:hypothetical protein
MLQVLQAIGKFKKLLLCNVFITGGGSRGYNLVGRNNLVRRWGEIARSCWLSDSVDLIISAQPEP